MRQEGESPSLGQHRGLAFQGDTRRTRVNGWGTANPKAPAALESQQHRKPSLGERGGGKEIPRRNSGCPENRTVLASQMEECHRQIKRFCTT